MTSNKPSGRKARALHTLQRLEKQKVQNVQTHICQLQKKKSAIQEEIVWISDYIQRSLAVMGDSTSVAMSGNSAEAWHFVDTLEQKKDALLSELISVNVNLEGKEQEQRNSWLAIRNLEQAYSGTLAALQLQILDKLDKECQDLFGARIQL